jgi:hypothetical protein
MGGNDSKVWLNGREEIANIIGRSPRAIPKLVRDEDLPAFKFYGTWTATLADVTAWSSEVAKRYRPRQRRKK